MVRIVLGLREAAIMLSVSPWQGLGGMMGVPGERESLVKETNCQRDLSQQSVVKNSQASYGRLKMLVLVPNSRC